MLHRSIEKVNIVSIIARGVLLIFKLLIIIVSLLVIAIGIICLWGCVESFLGENYRLFTFLGENHRLFTSIETSLADVSKYESLFSPAAAFFAGAAALFTAVVLYKQINMAKLQKEESIKNMFHEQLNMMISMRTDIVNSIVYIDKDEKQEIGKSVFYTIVDEIYNEEKGDKNIDEENTKQPSSFIDNLFSIISETICGILKNAINENDCIARSKIVNINKKIEKSTKGTMSPFFHNVYTTLKMINGNKNLTSEDKQDYLRMFRSHFSQPEFVIIYYHALFFNDYGEMKFKQLIEDTCFFHSLMHDYIPFKVAICEEDTREKLGYSYKAFFHSKSEYEDYKTKIEDYRKG